MNRRAFLTAPLLALPALALAAPVSVEWFDYVEFPGELRMRIKVIDRREAYFVTDYFKVDPGRYHVGIGRQVERIEDLDWLRRFYPEALSPHRQVHGQK